MDYRALAIEAARRNGVPEDLFLRLVQQESGFNPQARSPVGAIGLGQLMPGTARDLGVDPYNPAQNLDGSARYLAQQLQAFGDPKLALAAYNAGPGNVRKYGGVPPFAETQNYVQKVLGGAAPAAPAAPRINTQFDQRNVSGGVLQALARLEGVYGGSLPIGGVNSAYRDPEHNARVGGAKHSQHTHGNALDFDVAHLPIPERIKLIQNARAAGFSGVGVYENSLHFDVGPDRYWGPSYKADSLPAWAAEAVRAPVGQLASGQPNISTEGQPMGLLDFLSPSDQAADEEPRGFFNQDARHRLAIALEGMTLNPNDTMMKMLAAGIDKRAGERKDAKARNKTAQWLIARGRPDLAAAVTANSIDPKEAVSVALAPPANRPDLQENIEYLLQNGYAKTPQEAMDYLSNSKGGDYMGTIPAGHMVVHGKDANGNPTIQMVPIPGSPDAVEQQDLEAMQERQAEGRAVTADVVLTAIGDVRRKVMDGGLPTTGLIGGQLLKHVGGTDAYSVATDLNTITGNIAIDALQEMRNSNPTGGGLGAITERELEMLRQMKGNLAQARDRQEFLTSLDRLEKHYQHVMRKAWAYPGAEQFLGGGRIDNPPPAPTSTPQAGRAPRATAPRTITNVRRID